MRISLPETIISLSINEQDLIVNIVPPIKSGLPSQCHVFEIGHIPVKCMAEIRRFEKTL
jgi:hypothetical protein